MACALTTQQDRTGRPRPAGSIPFPSRFLAARAHALLVLEMEIIRRLC